MADSSSDDDCQAVDVYDMPTDDLKAKLAMIEQSAKVEHDEAKLIKLRRLAEVMQLEVDERAMATDFEVNCEMILGSWDAVAQEVQFLLEKNKYMLINEPKRASECNEIISNKKENFSRVTLPELDHQRLMAEESPQSVLHNNSRISRSTSNSRAPTSTQFSEYNIQGDFDAVDQSAPTSQYQARQAVGKAGWLKFVKNTLNTTKVTEQTVSVGVGVFKRPPRIGRLSKGKTYGSPRTIEKTSYAPSIAAEIESKKKRRDASKAYGEITRQRNTNDVRHSGDVKANETSGAYSESNKVTNSNLPDRKSLKKNCESVGRFAEAENDLRPPLTQRKPYGKTSDSKKYRISKQKSFNSLHSADKSTKDSYGEPQSYVSGASKKTRDANSSLQNRHSTIDILDILPIEPDFEVMQVSLEPVESLSMQELYYFVRVYKMPTLQDFEGLEVTFELFEIKKAQIKAPLKPIRNHVKENSAVSGQKRQHLKESKNTTAKKLNETLLVNQRNWMGNKKSESNDMSDKFPKKSKVVQNPPTSLINGLPKIEKSNKNQSHGMKIAQNDDNIHSIGKYFESKTDQVSDVKKCKQRKLSSGIESANDDKHRRKTTRCLETHKSGDASVREELAEKAIQQIQIYRTQKPAVKQMMETADLRSLLPDPMDYSDQIPTWNHLFSETYCHKSGYDPDILGVMRDVVDI